MRTRLRSRKAQFFILSAFAIVSIVYFMARWIEPFTIIDTSQVVLQEEAFIFNNVKEKAVEVVEKSKSCEELKYNLDEYRRFVQAYGAEKGQLILHYQFISPCKDEPPTPVVVEFNLTLISAKMTLSNLFYAGWKPG